MEVKSWSKHHIDAIVCAENKNYWRCTWIYRHLEMCQKHHTWTLLKRLANLSSLSWLYFGDFNEILWRHEKIGGNNREASMMQMFRGAVRNCSLVDLGCKGCPLMWSNKRYEPHLIVERLDCFSCNQEWRNMFLESVAETLETWTSDHNPILMEVMAKGRGLRYNKRTFPWVHYEDF